MAVLRPKTSLLMTESESRFNIPKTGGNFQLIFNSPFILLNLPDNKNSQYNLGLKK